MKPIDFSIIKKNALNRRWTSEETQHLKDMIKNNIRASDLRLNPKIMNKYFPGRSYPSIESKIRHLRSEPIE